MSFDLHYAENWTNLIMVNCRGVAEGMALPWFDFNFLLVVSLQKTKNAIAPKQMTSTPSTLKTVASVPQPLQQLCNIIKAIGKFSTKQSICKEN